MLRDDVRADITTAARATHRALAEKMSPTCTRTSNTCGARSTARDSRDAAPGRPPVGGAAATTGDRRTGGRPAVSSAHGDRARDDAADDRRPGR